MTWRGRPQRSSPLRLNRSTRATASHRAGQSVSRSTARLSSQTPERCCRRRAHGRARCEPRGQLVRQQSQGAVRATGRVYESRRRGAWKSAGSDCATRGIQLLGRHSGVRIQVRRHSRHVRHAYVGPRLRAQLRCGKRGSDLVWAHTVSVCCCWDRRTTGTLGGVLSRRQLSTRRLSATFRSMQKARWPRLAWASAVWVLSASWPLCPAIETQRLTAPRRDCSVCALARQRKVRHYDAGRGRGGAQPGGEDPRGVGCERSPLARATTSFVRAPLTLGHARRCVLVLLKMHVPYLVKVFDGRPFTLVPVVVGALTPESEAVYGRLLAPYLDDPATLVVVSSDFCHWGRRFGYTPHDKSQGPIHAFVESMDRRGMQLIEAGDTAGFTRYLQDSGNTICGRHPIGVLLHMMSTCTTPGLRARFLAYAQSSRAVHSSDSSVSYASAVVH